MNYPELESNYKLLSWQVNLERDSSPVVLMAFFDFREFIFKKFNR